MVKKSKDLEMFPEFNDKKLVDVVAESKKDLNRTQHKLKMLRKKRGHLVQSLGFTRKENRDWGRVMSLEEEIAEIDLNIKKAEEEICYLEREVLTARWVPKALDKE